MLQPCDAPTPELAPLKPLCLPAETDLFKAPHLCTLRAVRAHRAARLPERVWPRLLRNLGVDVGILAEVAPAGAAVIVAEQAGSLWQARDRMRVGLLDALVRFAGFDPIASGLYDLRCDRIARSGYGLSLQSLQLHPGLGPVRLLPRAVIQATRGLTYAALRCDERLIARLSEVVALGLRLLEAGRDPATCSRLLADLVFESLPPGLRPLVWAGRSSAEQRAVAADLAGHDLDGLAALLRGMRARLAPGLPWAALWAGCNEALHGRPVHSLDAVFARMLTAVVDPEATAAALAQLTDAPRSAPAPLAALEADGRLIIVSCQPSTGRLSATDLGGQPAPLSWDQVQAAASQGLARPAGELEYLLMAAAGYYLLVDPTEEVAPFQAAAGLAHQRLTGHPFPWIRAAGDATSPDLDALSPAFHPDFEARRGAWLEAFVHG